MGTGFANANDEWSIDTYENPDGQKTAQGR